ncbi:MAG: acetylxylan esterase [Planctomycetaceae bacterium]|jgi:cephalosporin-C deacetylase-like acetyl esterase|nr:acetylxylan esterase [Planctomycetaceae bacterium]
MKRMIIFVLFTIFFLSNTSAQNAEKPFNGDVLSADAKPKEMMKIFLSGEIAKAKTVWQRRYDKLKTVNDITKYQAERKEFFLQQLGKTWDRNASLNPQVTKTLEKGISGKNAYRVEMLVFESIPQFYVSAAVFLPDETRFKPPYPAVLVVSGHSGLAKSYEIYQKVPALAASNGLLAMSIDPIAQGERSQFLTDKGKGVADHNIIGTGSILLGRNTATFEYWDMVRAIDYLQSRPDVMPDKIGVTGNSGGGTQTSYIMALDERVTVAAPSCYLCGLYDSILPKIEPQDAEQNIFGQLAFGMDHVDYCIMRAPKPTLIETATKDFFPVEDAWKTARNAKRIFDRFGYAEKMSIIEHDNEHGWHQNLREGSVRWMLRWLAGRDEQIAEVKDMPIFKPNELIATPDGEVLKIAGARSTFNLNRDYNNELLAIRKTKNENRNNNEFVATIRNITGVRPLAEIPEVSVENKGKTNIPETLTEIVAEIERFVIKTENGKILLPALKFVPKTESKGTAIFLHEKGKTADLPQIETLLRNSKTVVAVDLRGLGETQAIRSQYYNHQWFGTDGTDYYLAYLLGKSYVGMRTEDLLVIARWLSENNSVNNSVNNSEQKIKQKIEIVASGETVGLIALHAAVLEPSLFSNVKLDKPIRSWYDVVQVGRSFYPITNLVHGALLEYDVPDLLQSIKPEQ